MYYEIKTILAKRELNSKMCQNIIMWLILNQSGLSECFTFQSPKKNKKKYEKTKL